MATQNFKRDFLLILYREWKKNLTLAAYFLHLGAPSLPACYLLNEMVGWQHQPDGHEFEQAPGVGDGQGSLVRCSPWAHKESHMLSD